MAGEWMFMNPALRPLALLWGRWELPRYRQVLNRVAGWDPMPGAPRRRVRGKLHGYLMDLDLEDWPERWAYFLGRYYEAHTQRLFELALCPGDVFVDIGANIGMTALVAARRVSARGKSGRVLCFEPNPAAMARLRGHVAVNGLEELVECRAMGLAERAGELDLHVPAHSGQASFAGETGGPGGPGGSGGHEGVRRVRVPVGVGDEQLAAERDAPMFIKIDVEGYELRVLRGLAGTLERRAPAVLTEAIPSLLERAGDSLEALGGFMGERGYGAWCVDYAPAMAGWPGRLSLRRVDGEAMSRGQAGPLTDDLLWLPVRHQGPVGRPEGEFARRLAGVIQAAEGSGEASTRA